MTRCSHIIGNLVVYDVFSIVEVEGGLGINENNLKTNGNHMNRKAQVFENCSTDLWDSCTRQIALSDPQVKSEIWRVN